MEEIEWIIGTYVGLGSVGYLYGGPRMAAICLLGVVASRALRAAIDAGRKDLE